MPDIHHSFVVKAAPSKVFEAMTSVKGLGSWWPLSSKGEPKLNEVYTFYFGPEYDWRGQVIHVIPDKELTWKMTQCSDDWVGTEVGFILTSENSDTRIRFFHKGWQEVSDHFEISSFCWAMLLSGMKNYVEKGIVIPHAERN